MAKANNLTVRITPVLTQLFETAEASLMTDPVFRANFMEYWRMVIVSRWAVRLLHTAVMADESINWQRLKALYNQHHDYEDEKVGNTRMINLRDDGRQQVREIIQKLTDNPDTLAIVKREEPGGIRVPQVEILLFALQYTIDHYREKLKRE